MKNSSRDYLHASGATAICVTESDGVAALQVCRNVASIDNLVSVQWLDERQAVAVARDARRGEGYRPDAETVSAELRRAALAHHATLTPDDVARSRAENGAHRIERHLEAMRQSGGLRQFNAEYRRRRSDASAQGHGFMSYSAAMTRLRHALIPHLMAQSVGPMQSIFERVFR